MVVFLHVGFGNVIVEEMGFHRLHNALTALDNVFMVSSCIIEYIKLNSSVWNDITSALVALT